MSSALVPYVARTVTPGMRRALPYMMTGMTRARYNMARLAARRAVNIRRSGFVPDYVGKYAARKIQRAFRNRRAKRKAARSIGQRVGTSSAKRKATASTSTESLAQKSDRAQYYDEITFPSFGDAINERERRVINLRGIHLCMEISAGSALLIGGAYRDRNVYVNVCVVSSKKDPTSTAVSTNHFFRDSTSNRAIDFDALQRSIDFHCRPINSDEWNVHMHYRTVLGGEAVESNPTIRRIMKYIPFKRQIRFDETGEPDSRLFLVWWTSLAGEHTATPFANIFKSQYYVTAYYREPK